MKKNKKIILSFILIFVIGIIFIGNVGAEQVYDNFNEDALLKCGTIKNIPSIVPKIVSIAYTITQILVPIALVIYGSFDLVKAVMGQKEDEIKKGQQTLIKRLVEAVIIFFLFAIVKLVISLVADDKEQTNGIVDCMECFIQNKCDRQIGG